MCVKGFIIACGLHLIVTYVLLLNKINISRSVLKSLAYNLIPHSRIDFTHQIGCFPFQLYAIYLLGYS